VTFFLSLSNHVFIIFEGPPFLQKFLPSPASLSQRRAFLSFFLVTPFVILPVIPGSLVPPPQQVELNVLFSLRALIVSNLWRRPPFARDPPPSARKPWSNYLFFSCVHFLAEAPRSVFRRSRLWCFPSSFFFLELSAWPLFLLHQ